MANERFFLIKDGGREGPFDEAYVRFLLENDEVGFEDLCETDDGQRFRLGTLYEPVGAAGSADGSSDPPLQAAGKAVRGGRTRQGRVLYAGHPSFLKYPLAWLLVILGCVGGSLLGPHSLWGMLAGFGVASLAITYIVVERSSHLYVITSRRIEAVHGLLAKDSTEVRIEDIRTINVKREGIPGVLGVGTVEFSSSGDVVAVSFADLWGARKIKKLVRRLQDELEA